MTSPRGRTLSPAESRADTGSVPSTTARQASRRGSKQFHPAALVASLASLTRAERAEADRIHLSSISWFRDVSRIRASTLPRVWTSVLGFTLFSTFIAVAHITYGKEWRLSNNVVPLLSVIVGLLLVFRNSTAFSRWDDARKTFNAQAGQVRNMARFVWVNLGAATYDATRANPYQHPNFTEADREEKRQNLRLMVAVVIATKRHVRAEYGLLHDDLNSLVPPALMKQMTLSIAEEAREQSAVDPSETSPLLNNAEAAFVEQQSQRPSLPLPLVLIHQLSLYFAKARAKGFLDLAGPAGFSLLQSYLSALTVEMGTVERLGSLPIPAVYGIHLKQVVTVFLCVLPFTLVSDLSFMSIPFITVYAFILQGIEAIASEIEAPFGDDPSDLPLDLLCAELRNEVEHIIARLPET